MKKIIINNFLGLLVGEQIKEKNVDEKKKKRVSGARMGYYPFSQSESRYNAMYRDTAGAPGHNTAERCMLGWPRYGRDRPRHGQDRPRHGRPRARACGSTCM